MEFKLELVRTVKDCSIANKVNEIMVERFPQLITLYNKHDKFVTFWRYYLIIDFIKELMDTPSARIYLVNSSRLSRANVTMVKELLKIYYTAITSTKFKTVIKIKEFAVNGIQFNVPTSCKLDDIYKSAFEYMPKLFTSILGIPRRDTIAQYFSYFMENVKYSGVYTYKLNFDLYDLMLKSLVMLDGDVKYSFIKALFASHPSTADLSLGQIEQHIRRNTLAKLINKHSIDALLKLYDISMTPEEQLIVNKLKKIKTCNFNKVNFPLGVLLSNTRFDYAMYLHKIIKFYTYVQTHPDERYAWNNNGFLAHRKIILGLS